jgi:hypothetical protein
MNLFGCELAPNAAVNDYYTIQGGGAAQPDAKLPSDTSVEKAVPTITDVAAPKEETPYVQPTNAQANTRPSGSDPLGAELDAELERSQAGDTSGLDEALEIS